MKNRIVIIIITVLLLAVGVYFAGIQIKEENPVAFRVEVTSDGHTEHIDYWQGPDGCFYVFLPGYVAFEDIKFDVRASKAFINGEELKDGMSCAAFEKNCFYDFSYRSWGKTYTGQIQFMQSANIATMYIGTDSGSMDHIHQLKGNEESGNMVLYAADGQLDYSGRLDGIKGRGNSTWTQYEKKPYNIRLEKQAGLLDMEEAEKWILLANASDASNMRNKIVYDFAERVGLQYTPDTQWVDLYLNGEYGGLYLLSERIEIGEGRVEIGESRANEDGSYIASMQLQESVLADGELHFMTNAAQCIRIDEPKAVSQEQYETIIKEWRSLENAILAEDGIDPQTGIHYLEMIDLESWTKKYLIEEVFANDDACAISQYFYCDNRAMDSLIYAGPVWDYDYSMGGNVFDTPKGFVANREYVTFDRYTPWFYYLYQKNEFYTAIIETYSTIYLPEFDELIAISIPTYRQQIREASLMNEVRWFDKEVEFDSEVEDITNYLNSRIEFLNDVWIENVEYCIVGVASEPGENIVYYAKLPGETLEKIKQPIGTPNVEFAGWYEYETDLPYDLSQPIYEDMHIYAKWEPIE